MKSLWPLLLLCCLLPVPLSAQPPALPPGLEEPAKPAPPDGGAPALPPGLGGAESAPALPPDLGSGTSAPALPPGLGGDTAQAPQAESAKKPRLPELHGFWELRGGLRTQNDAVQPSDATIGETRLQLKYEHAWDRIAFDFTGDTILDGVLNQADFELRQARITAPIGEHIDLRIGRQVLTWGTGDMLFINDLFPKDWQSFFIGRDVEYLKAPSDSIKGGYYSDAFNFELVYTPRFAPDRYIKGERISYWNPLAGGHSGEDWQVKTRTPGNAFASDEWAARLYKRAGKFELALYGYSGYWKSPGGQIFPPPRATFPGLNVYGASVRGPVGKGIFNAEAGYYDSRHDRKGGRFLINNSEFRLLLGYEQELGKNFTGAVQYYLEHLLDYSDYRRTLPFFMPVRDEDRHVVTVRLTKLLMDQNLTLSLFAYYSPSDSDLYARPHVSYKVDDHWAIESGANLFAGAADTTFFGQFENNTNVYLGARYSF